MTQGPGGPTHREPPSIAAYDVDLLDSWNVVAAESGTVVEVSQFSTGLTIVIDDGNNRFFEYTHLASTAVRVGQMIGRGDEVGKIGWKRSGIEPHLHFGVTDDVWRPVVVCFHQMHPEQPVVGRRYTSHTSAHGRRTPVRSVIGSTALLQNGVVLLSRHHSWLIDGEYVIYTVLSLTGAPPVGFVRSRDDADTDDPGRIFHSRARGPIYRLKLETTELNGPYYLTIAARPEADTQWEWLSVFVRHRLGAARK